MARDLETKEKLLFTLAMKGKWEDVINLYKEDPRLQKAKITSSGDTALHVAVFDGNEEAVKQMVELAASWRQHCKEALETRNERKNTALHIAASLGNLRMCGLIAQQHPSLVSVRNVDGETPLFLAARYGRKEAFLCLHHLSHPNGSLPNYDTCRKNGADTILHCAIAGNFYDLAFQIIHLYPELVNWVNEDGLSPLHLLAAKPFDFKSGSYLGRNEMIIYHCMFVEELEIARYHHQVPFSEADERKTICGLPENYRTCCGFFGAVKSLLVPYKFPVVHFSEKKIFPRRRPSNAEDPEVAECKAHDYASQLHPENYETCSALFRFVFLAVAVILGPGRRGLTRIRRDKEKHVWCLQVMNELLSRASWYEYENDGGEPRAVYFASDMDYSYFLDKDRQTIRPDRQQQDAGGKDSKKKRIETAILIAAKNGVSEMVEKIIELFPVAIHDMDEEKKNAVLLAVEHRQPHVYQLLVERNIIESAFWKVDHNGNSALHLAANYGQYKPWLIPGSALQMQWEIKWFEYVKSFLPSHYTFLTNKEGETPGEIFLKHHTNLLEKSDEWLGRTSESCSVVAALVAGVAFATSSTVPGGNDDKTGKPTLEGHPQFDIFAMTALTALCFSVSALIMFLSILTSRKQPTDFMTKLPVKLFLALSSLFVSIISMSISFCAAHSFVLEEKFKKSVLLLYAIYCLPVYFTIAEFPLYMDLLEGIFMKVSRPYDHRRI